MSLWDLGRGAEQIIFCFEPDVYKKPSVSVYFVYTTAFGGVELQPPLALATPLTQYLFYRVIVPVTETPSSNLLVSNQY